MLFNSFFLGLSLLAAPFLLEGKFEDLKLNSEGVILINLESGTVLFEKCAHEKFFPASITKIATVAYALKVRGSHLDRKIAAEQDSIAFISDKEMERSNYKLPSHWLTTGVMHIGIKRGEILSLKDLIYGAMLASGGDASNVIAQYIGGTIPTFIQLMNGYLQEIGCKDTVFKNPHGLHHPEHLTTPYDMALLTRDAMQNEAFCEVVKTLRYPRPETNKQKESMLLQTNQLLRKGKFFYSKAIGVKTGYHSKAQNTLVAAAKDGDRTLIAVLMKCKKREDILADAKKLFDEAFKEKRVIKRFLSKGPFGESLKLPHADKKVQGYLKDDAALEYYPSEVPEIKCQLRWSEIVLPVEKDELIGEIRFLDQKETLLATFPLYSQDDVGFSRSFRFKRFIEARFWIKFIGGFFGILLIGGLIYELKRSIRR